MRHQTIVGIALLGSPREFLGAAAPILCPLAWGHEPVAPQAASPAPRPPGSLLAGYTLTRVSPSGVVYESTPTGRVPLPKARVYCELRRPETHTFATADASGATTADTGDGSSTSRTRGSVLICEAKS